MKSETGLGKIKRTHNMKILSTKHHINITVVDYMLVSHTTLNLTSLVEPFRGTACWSKLSH